MSHSSKLLFPVALGLFLFSPYIAINYNPNNYSQGRSRDEQARIERNSSSVAQLFGELRTSMSDILFLKTERYLHGGIAYSPHMEVAKSVQEESKEYDEHEAEVGHEGEEHDHDHDGHQDHAAEDHEIEAATAIPTAQKDHRGFIGAFEREIRPWIDPTVPHVHTSGKELLPWYRVMTLSDPKNVRGYMIGTYWLCGAAKFDEALEFISEGIRNNPDSFQLPLYKGRAILRKLNYIKATEGQGDLASEELDNYVDDEVIEQYLIATELVFKFRPEVFDMRTQHPTWSDYMEDDAGAAVRSAVSSLRRAGRLEEALELAKRGAPRLSFYDENGNFYPEDPKLLEYIQNLEEMIALGVTE